MTAHSTLTTARLRLRPLVASDEGALVVALNDWEVVRWLVPVPFPYESADFQAFLPLAEPGKVWVIEDDKRLAGLIEIDDLLGYWLARSAWGQGYATEAARAVLAAHFAESAAGPVGSGYFEGNARSANVLTKLGFRVTGYTRRRTVACPDKDMLSCRMLLARADWLAAEAARPL